MDRIHQLAINSEGFIFDPLSGESYTVNETGLQIIQDLKQNKSTEEIIEKLKVHFENLPDTIDSDITDFLSHLKTYRLL